MIDQNSKPELILAHVKKEGWGFFENPMGENRIFVQTRMNKADARREWRYSTTCGSVATDWEKRAPGEVADWLGRLKYIPIGMNQPDRVIELQSPVKTFEPIEPRKRVKTVYATLNKLVSDQGGVLDLKEAKRYLQTMYGDEWRPDSQGAIAAITAAVQMFNRDHPQLKAIELWPLNEEKKRGQGFRYEKIVSLDAKYADKVAQLGETKDDEENIPPMMSSSQLIRLLIKKGFLRGADKGGHVYLEHPDGRKVQVPASKTQFPKATYYAMLKQAGLKKPKEAA